MDLQDGLHPRGADLVEVLEAGSNQSWRHTHGHCATGQRDGCGDEPHEAGHPRNAAHFLHPAVQCHGVRVLQQRPLPHSRLHGLQQVRSEAGITQFYPSEILKRLFQSVATGAVGAICARAHLATARFARVIADLRIGEPARARASFAQLASWIETAYAAPNPIAIKQALALEGWIAPTVRPSLVACTTDVRTRMAACVDTFRAGAV